MKIDSVYIKNFRSIKEATISVKDLTILIGNNGTGKTTILEAVHFALSPNFLSGKIEPSDFYNNTPESIIIDLIFINPFDVEIPDLFNNKQIVSCNKIHLNIKKREKATSGKSFTDGYVIENYYVPVAPKTDENSWDIKRKNGSIFKFSERQLAVNYSEPVNSIRSFYFAKNRNTQIRRGYNSSITNVFDDFNWRFIHHIESNPTDYYIKKQNFEEQILYNIDDKSIKKSFTTLNEKLKDFGIPEVSISFIESNAPFNSAFLSNKINSLDIKVDNLGSGVEMIISLLYLETLASLSNEEILIIIDEPELHLHPSLQEKFIQYLKNISSEKQIIVSTHSPYFFKNCCSDKNIKLLVTKLIDNQSQIKDAEYQLSTFSWSPSWGEINYYAYEIVTVEFHNELYGYLQSLCKIYEIKDFDNHLVSLGENKNKKWIQEKDERPFIYDLTLMTYIRNFLHHPENQINPIYTNDELKISIQKMLNLIKKITFPYF